MKPKKPKKDEYITTRPEWKAVVNRNHAGFDQWLYGHSCISYYDGVNDAIVAAMMVLHDDNGFGTKRLAAMVDRIYDTIDSINKRLISADEIVEGLKSEGVNIGERRAKIE